MRIFEEAQRDTKIWSTWTEIMEFVTKSLTVKISYVKMFNEVFICVVLGLFLVHYVLSTVSFA